MSTAQFPSVTLLITHYNRSKSLERLLSTFAELQISFGDVVVSDDCSKPEHLDLLKKLQANYGFNLVTTPVNGGLGNNLNKGQDAVKTPYTLYVQEDFVPTPKFLTPFIHALNTLEQVPDMDIARFYAYSSYPYLKPYSGGFSEMLYKLRYPDTSKIYKYSDHPHLRRSNFLEKFGRYKEGIKSDRTEYLMCVSFIQKGGKGIFYNDFKSLFLQENSSDEPSTVTRSNWKNSHNPAIAIIRNVYRQVKYNYDVKFRKLV